MQEPRHPSVADVDELDAAIAAAGSPLGHAISFQTDQIVLYLLDTNAISDLMRPETRMASWLASIGIDDHVVICTVTRGEILFGLERLGFGTTQERARRGSSQAVRDIAV